MKLNVTPVVTFDQPLYCKSVTIIAAEPENSQLKGTVVMLGGFHTRMSYLSANGFIMADSGLSDVLEQVHACNSVTHMLTGKAIARATRGNILVESALSILLIASKYNVSIGDLEMGTLRDDCLTELLNTYERLSNNTMDLEEECYTDVVMKLHEQLQITKASFMEERTACL